MDTQTNPKNPDVTAEAGADVETAPPESDTVSAATEAGGDGAGASDAAKQAKKSPNKKSEAKKKADKDTADKEAEAKEQSDAADAEGELADVPLIEPLERALKESEIETKKKKRKKIKEKKIKSALGSKRGVETMFRASYRVQMDLTALADAKANIMITINGLILSILLASIASKIDTNPYLFFPTSITLTTCVLSIIFAVLAAIPRVESSPITLDEVRRRNTNLLFFGNFSKLSREDYHTGMVEMMLDPDRVYHNMISDIYGIGSVLTKKFKLLRTSYIIFMAGVILSVVLFIITFFLNAGDAVPLQPPPNGATP